MSVQNIHLSKVEKGWQISSNKINDSDLLVFRYLRLYWRASFVHDVQIWKWKLVLYSVWQGIQK